MSTNHTINNHDSMMWDYKTDFLVQMNKVRKDNFLFSLISKPVFFAFLMNIISCLVAVLLLSTVVWPLGILLLVIIVTGVKQSIELLEY